MPHKSGKCACGRTIHFPKNAALGYEWKCKSCGRVYVLSTQGSPLNTVGSKAPPAKKRGNGCFGIIVFIFVIYLLYSTS